MTNSIYIKQEVKRRRKQRKRERQAEGFIKLIIVLIIAVFIFFYIDFLRFPECYLSTWRYQLKNEIAAGDQESITYYNTHYIKYGRTLYE